jgi:hypothetical protein
MEELVKNDRRVVAPAAGVDVVAVLAHVLRARKLERWLCKCLREAFVADFGWRLAA